MLACAAEHGTTDEGIAREFGINSKSIRNWANARPSTPGTKGGVRATTAPSWSVCDGRTLGCSARAAGRGAHGHLAELVQRDPRTSHPMVAVAATGDIVEAS